MTASLWPWSGTETRDLNGRAYVGATTQFYLGGTTTPLTVFADNSLSTPLGTSVQADAFGRWPSVFIPVVVTNNVTQTYGWVTKTSQGSQVYAVSAVDPAPAGVASGGGGGTVDPATIFQTGDVLWAGSTAARTGWIKSNGRTIGSGTSGATERANADCQALFTFLWNTFPDAICPVTGGRGATAAADWGANKQIATVNMQGAGLAGLDGMGAPTSGVYTGVPFANGDATTPGSRAGANTVTLDPTQIPAHSHSGSLSTDGAHVHSQTGLNTTTAGGGATFNAWAGGNAAGTTVTNVTGSAGAHTHTVTINNTGGGAAHNNVPRSVLGTWFQKL